MKKYFSPLSLFVALPALFYPVWYILDSYSTCKELISIVADNIPSYCNSLFFGHIPTGSSDATPFFGFIVSFIATYIFSWFITKKAENPIVRILGLVLMLILFFAFIGFALLALALNNALT